MNRSVQDTTYLSLKPSLLKGLARLVDLTGSIDVFKYMGFNALSDQKVLREDWYQIGKDFFEAINVYNKKSNIDGKRYRKKASYR